MTVTHYDLTATFTDLLGAAYSPTTAPVIAWVETNVANTEGIVDEVANAIALGGSRQTADSSGAITWANLVGSDSDPADINLESGTLQYRVTAEYRSTITRRRERWVSSWFSLTADVDLADVVAETYVPAAWMTTAIAELQGYVDEGADLLAQQEVISGLTGEDGAVAALVADSGSDTSAALSATFVSTVSPIAFGAAADDTTDDRIALQAAVDEAALALFGTVDLRGFTYKITDDIEVPDGVKVCNGKIRCTGTAKKGLVPVGNGVTIKDVELVGRHATSTASADEDGLYAVGASAAVPLTDLHLENVTTSLWGKHGIFLKYVERYTIKNCHSFDNGYGGIVGLSVLHGKVIENNVHDILAGFSGNGYGIAFSREETDSLVTDPHSSYNLAQGNHVQGIPWEGIDCHGGIGNIIDGNHVLGCKVGIAIVESDNASNVATWAPKRTSVTNNYVDSLVTDGSAGIGILIAGVPGATEAAAANDYATVLVQGNTVRGHGDQSAATSGAIVARNTLAMGVEANVTDTPSPHGIHLLYDNRAVSLVGNTTIDAWSNTHTDAAAIYCSGSNNTGTAAGNTIIGGGKSATTVNARGFSGSPATTSFIAGINNFAAAALPVTGSGITAAFNSTVSTTGVFRASAGTLSAVALSFTADPNTGFNNPSGDQIGIVTNGVQRARWTTGLLFDEGTPIAFGSTTGTMIGTGATQKMGFWGKTPVVRPTSTPADATDLATALTLINDLKAKLIAVGLIS